MPSRLKDSTVALRLEGASVVISGSEQERIVFPAIVFAEEEVAPTRNLSVDDRFEVVSVEVQQIPAAEARRGSFGHAVDIDEARRDSPVPIRVGLSLALPPANFRELAERVTKIKERPIELVVEIGDEDEVARLIVNGEPVEIQPQSDFGSSIGSSEASRGVG